MSNLVHRPFLLASFRVLGNSGNWTLLIGSEPFIISTAHTQSQSSRIRSFAVAAVYHLRNYIRSFRVFSLFFPFRNAFIPFQTPFNSVWDESFWFFIFTLRSPVTAKLQKKKCWKLCEWVTVVDNVRYCDPIGNVLCAENWKLKIKWNYFGELPQNEIVHTFSLLSIPSLMGKRHKQIFHAKVKCTTSNQTMLHVYRSAVWGWNVFLFSHQFMVLPLPPSRFHVHNDKLNETSGKYGIHNSWQHKWRVHVCVCVTIMRSIFIIYFYYNLSFSIFPPSHSVSSVFCHSLKSPLSAIYKLRRVVPAFHFVHWQLAYKTRNATHGTFHFHGAKLFTQTTYNIQCDITRSRDLEHWVGGGGGWCFRQILINNFNSIRVYFCFHSNWNRIEYTIRLYTSTDYRVHRHRPPNRRGGVNRLKYDERMIKWKIDWCDCTNEQRYTRSMK